MTTAVCFLFFCWMPFVAVIIASVIWPEEV